jgi:hypothetical protein
MSAAVARLDRFQRRHDCVTIFQLTEARLFLITARAGGIALFVAETFVALARKLLVALWHYAKDSAIPEGAKVKTDNSDFCIRSISGPRPAAIVSPGPERAPFFRTTRTELLPECPDHGQGSTVPPVTRCRKCPSLENQSLPETRNRSLTSMPSYRAKW